MSQVKVSQPTRFIFSGTVRHIQAGFILDRQARGLAKGTVNYYLDELTRFSDFLDSQGVIAIEEISPDVLRRYLLFLGATRNRGGVHAGYRAVRAMLVWYEDEFEPDGWKNPIRKVKAPSPKDDPLPGVSLEDIFKMVDACNGSNAGRDWGILLALVDTGARARLCMATIALLKLRMQN